MPTTKSSKTTNDDKTKTTAEVTEDTAAVGKAWVDALAEKTELDKVINNATKRKQVLLDLLREGAGSASVITYRGKVVAEQSFRTRRSVDLDLLRKAFPNAAEACEKEDTYSVFRKA